MELSQYLKEYLATEFRNAAKGMKESEEDDATAMYFFSACHGAVLRALNMECSGDLVLLHFVLNGCHTMAIGRIEQVRQKQERPIQIPPQFAKKLSEIVEKFPARFEADEDFIDLLKAIAVLAHATTGNGYYLCQTGRLLI